MFFHSCLFLEHSIFCSKIEIALIHRQARGVYKRRFTISSGQFVNMPFSMNILVKITPKFNESTEVPNPRRNSHTAIVSIF